MEAYQFSLLFRICKYPRTTIILHESATFNDSLDNFFRGEKGEASQNWLLDIEQTRSMYVLGTVHKVPYISLVN